MNIEEAKKAITLERIKQDRVPYPSRDHTLLWFVRNLKEAIAEVERLGRANAVFLDAFSQEKIESLIKDLKLQEQDNIRIIQSSKAAVESLTEEVETKRKTIHDLETRCDPAGDVQRIASLTEQVRGLEAEVTRFQLEGNIRCVRCRAVYPDPHIYPCTL